MNRLLILLPLLLTACNDEQGPTAKIPDGGKPFAVPDANHTGLLIAVVVLALICAALVEKWMKGDK